MTEQYEKYCKQQFEKADGRVDKIDNKVDEIHAIVTNGLKDKVKENNDRIKSLDNRIWFLMTGVVLSVGLQILFRVI